MSDNPLKRTYSYPVGMLNNEGEIEATEDGIEIDTGTILSWEWIDKAREELQRLKNQREDEDISAEDCARGEMTEEEYED